MNNSFTSSTIRLKNYKDYRVMAVDDSDFRIAALPDKELDLDLKFKVRAQSKRLLYMMKTQA